MDGMHARRYRGAIRGRRGGQERQTGKSNAGRFSRKKGPWHGMRNTLFPQGFRRRSLAFWFNSARLTEGTYCAITHQHWLSRRPKEWAWRHALGSDEGKKSAAPSISTDMLTKNMREGEGLRVCKTADYGGTAGVFVGEGGSIDC